MLPWWLAAALCTALVALLAPLTGEAVNLKVALMDWSISGQHSTPDGLIFWQTRVPRVLTGLVAGAALACSGLAYQAVLRNPLADPYILGISSGAAVGKALAVLALPAALVALPVVTPLACFIGGLLPVLFLMRLSLMQQFFSPVTLLLAGVIFNLILSAAMMLVQVFAHPDDARRIAFWWLGGLETAGYSAPLVALAPVLAGIAVLVWRARAMNVLSVDALTANHLGVDVKREVLWLIGAGTLLAATSVALCGPIGFAGLLVPHILRLMAGPDHRLLVPLAALAGAGFLVLCDLLGWRGVQWLAAAGVPVRTAMEVPAGVITALLGGPVFLYLLVKKAV